MTRRKGKKGAPVHVNVEQSQTVDDRAPKKSGFFDFDTPYDIWPGLINQAALFKYMAQGGLQKHLYHGPTKAGAGFGLQRSAKPRRPVQGQANNIATYLEQSDADAWAQALDDMSTEQPAVQKKKKRAPSVLQTNMSQSRSVDEDPSSTAASASSPAAIPTTAEVAHARKRKSYAMYIDIAGLVETQDRCKKHAGRRSVTWSQDEGGDIVMCSCTDLSHVV